MRLTRAQQQERTRAAVLAAAHAEFAERGYQAVTVDRIADRAEMTRGAVYSNFPGKSALYLAVLLDVVEREPSEAVTRETHLEDALEAFARAWLDRLPMHGDTPAGAHLRLRSLDGVLDTVAGRTALGGVTQLETLLLGRALEACVPTAPRRVRLAGVVRTVLDGAGHLAAVAPGVGDPFDVVRACEHLADLPLTDVWEPTHLPFVKAAETVDEPWEAPAAAPDLINGEPVSLGDGVIVLLGAERLGAAEEAVRAAGERVTVVVAGSPETDPLVRLRVRDLVGCLRRAVDPALWPGFALLLDDGHVASALGVTPEPATECAVRITDGRVVARADHRGAGHAVAVVQ
ncbi:TetR/AcrR family transcriptional regulator [Cryptosporangium sp. NPDC048952]|uniref:TetR/AcrR family transcriptional regulator n=1 Tax=Cryptosporangium sp. NPDC048952 TaxID=3363961 RepID=UPI00371A99FD